MTKPIHHLPIALGKKFFPLKFLVVIIVKNAVWQLNAAAAATIAGVSCHVTRIGNAVPAKPCSCLPKPPGKTVFPPDHPCPHAPDRHPFGFVATYTAPVIENLGSTKKVAVHA
jgi:hypothetical protein